MKRRALFGLACVLCAAALDIASVRAQDADELAPSTAQVRQEVVALIGRQLADFRTKNYDGAYRLAAQALREQIPERQFMEIVRASYPEIWRNKSAAFGLVRSNASRATVAVTVQGAEGNATYDYVLLRSDSGWRIGGVMRHVPKPEESL